MDSNNTLMSHIARLREKMHEPSRKPKFTKTVWGWGIPLNDFDYTGRVSRKLLGQYALSLLGFLGAVSALAVLCVLFFGTFSF